MYVTPYDYAEDNPASNVDLWGLQAVPAREYIGFEFSESKIFSNFVENASKLKAIAIEKAKNSPINKISNNGYVTGSLNLVSGSFVTAAGISSLTAAAETGGTSVLPGLGILYYGLAQMSLGTVQIINQAAGNKKDIPSGPAALAGRAIDKSAKTNGSFENVGEYIDMGVSGKSVISRKTETKTERTVNFISFILSGTNKVLENNDKK